MSLSSQRYVFFFSSVSEWDMETDVSSLWCRYTGVKLMQILYTVQRVWTARITVI